MSAVISAKDTKKGSKEKCGSSLQFLGTSKIILFY
jgi:hypothetical protein